METIIQKLSRKKGLEEMIKQTAKQKKNKTAKKVRGMKRNK